MIAQWLRNAASWTGEPRKLIIAAFDLPDQSSHFFNEILAYRKWVFSLSDPPNADWLRAKLPRRPRAERDRPLDISFAIDAPRSPYELGVSGDRRRLGLGFLKLSVSAYPRKVARSAERVR